jgi:hypothetical protein
MLDLKSFKKDLQKKSSLNEKELLKELTKHKGFKLLEQVAKDFENIVLQKLKRVDT